MSLSLKEQYDKIYKYCYFKVKNAALAEDLTQETFLRFFDRNHYLNRGKPLAYLYTIARNLCIDTYRQKAEQPLQQLLPEEAGEPDAGLEALERSLAVRAGLATLKSEQQELLLLRFVNNLSMFEISTLTGLSRFAVRRKINGALNQLKTVLREEDFG